ncbi:unnamed protein product [Calicophoron daubneyi]|uniref:Ectonucleoside triphosphate diphosphohydrolase 1 n=1 Tax=Calicophoron daubneyi TaxID=300641 RepID=A0AAV2TBA7_CALDB
MGCFPEKRRKTLTLLTVLVVLSILGLVIICVVFGIAQAIGTKNAVVIDAGSSSSKLSLYQWKDDPFRTNALVQQVMQDKVKPPISAFVHDPFGAYGVLEGPLNRMVAGIPENKRSTVPVYLAATAGMRLELLKDPLSTLDLFDVLRRGLLKSGLDVEYPNERFRMLSGSEEGLYGWVSVNNILDKITASTQVSSERTIGSLDLGGASTQISFAPRQRPDSEKAAVDYYSLKLFGARYEVYSHSFLCYGKDQFEKRVHALIISSTSPSQNPIPHPCFPSGYTTSSKDANSFFDSPCITGAYAEKTFSKNPIKQPGWTTVQFVGTGNPDACRRTIEEQFNKTYCPTSPCSFNGVYQPSVSGAFRAYSGFSYVMAYLFAGKSTGFTKTEVMNAVRKFCVTPWNETAGTVGPSEQSIVAKYCFDGLYVTTLLENMGFGTDEQWKTITFGDKIDGASVSWALGYMLDQSGYLPSDSPKLNLPVAAFVPLLVIFFAILVVCVTMLIVIMHHEKEKEAFHEDSEH